MTINLHFIDACNFKCKHCFINKEKKELSLESIKRIIDIIYDYSIKHNEKIRINLAGGEPLLSKNIQKIIDYIYNKGLEVSIITNGFFLTKNFISSNINKISMIGISVDSLNNDINIKIGRESCNKTISKEQLTTICKFIKEAGIKLKINICLSKNNYRENLAPFLDEIKPDRVKVLRVLIEHDKLLEDVSLSDNEWMESIEKYKQIPNIIFEDNDYMKNSYIIIDSKGNLCKDNLHMTDNSIIEKGLFECLNNLNNVRGC